MSKTFSAAYNPKVFQYLEKTFQPEDAVLREIRERSVQKGLPAIQVGDFDGLHLEVLTRAIGAVKAVEIGTLGGYSGACIARGLPAHGKLFTFEMTPLHAEVARESFSKAGVSSKVEQYVGSALENLPKIQSQGPFDLVFIDADKVNYPNYLKWAAEHLRVGGVVLGDNTLAWGMIADEVIEDKGNEKAARSLREFNAAMASRDGRFRATMLPTGEGLTMGVKIR